MESEPLLYKAEVRKTRNWCIRIVVGCVAIVIAAAMVGFALVQSKRQIAPLARVNTLAESDRLSFDKTNRIIVMGDVHGMHHEMLDLLDKLDFQAGRDRLVLTGDFITKGTDSLGVIDSAIEYGAACVRGNHEDEILRLYVEHNKLMDLRTYPPHASKTTETYGQAITATLKPSFGPSGMEDIENPSNTNLPQVTGTDHQTRFATNDDLGQLEKGERDMKLVKQLKPHHIKYLESCPCILKLGQISENGEEAVVVHGGLEWYIHELEEQRPEVVMRIRNLLAPNWRTPAERADGKPWFKMWNIEQESQPSELRTEIVYGHAASMGLQLHDYSKGLDTKCSRGKKLSAMVFDFDSHGQFRQKLHQVKC